MSKELNSKKITKTYLNSESGLQEHQRQFLTYDNQGLVPCVLEQSKDSFTLVFDSTDFKPYQSVLSLGETEKLRVLAGAASLVHLINEYNFTLDPDNLLIDVNLVPKVVERKISDGTNDFLAQYKALIGYTLQSGHSYKHFLRGGAFLFNSNPILREIYKMENVDEIKSELIKRCDEAQKEQEEKYISIKKKSAKTYRRIIPILTVVAILACAATAYTVGYEAPRNRAVIEGHNAYLEEDYLGVQEAFENIDPESMSVHSQYILARSYVITEGLSNTQRENVLSAITLQTDSRYLCFWIFVGRLDFESAEDYAGRLDDDELMLYALCKHKISVQNDTDISGADKTTILADLTDRIEQLENKLEGERTTFEESQDDENNELISGSDAKSEEKAE